VNVSFYCKAFVVVLLVIYGVMASN